MQLMWKALALVAVPALGSATQVTPLQKVVEMLTNMAVKAKQMKNDEQVAYAKFDQWCGDEKARLEEQIAKETSELESLTSETARLVEDAKVLGEEVATLQSDIGAYESELKTETTDREKAHKDFLAEQQDYGESVDALERALVVLQSKSSNIPASLVQVQNLPGIPKKVQKVIEVALQLTGAGVQGINRPGASLLEATQKAKAKQEPNPLDYEAPEAAAYEFQGLPQSGGIIEMLKKLRDEFVSKKSELEKEEMNAQHAYDMVRQDLTNSIGHAKDSIGEKSALKSNKESKAAELKQQAASLAEVKASDEKLFSDTKVECAEKSESYEEKQQLRAEEIQALEKAIEILSGEDVAGGAKHLELAQVGKATSLAQLVRDTSVYAESGIRRQVREFLLAQSQKLHSKNLGLLVQRIETDPFAKVKKMISEMITRLLEEAKSDADHKAFCDKEIGQSKITRNKLSETIDGLTADVENGKAKIAMLTKDIAELESDIASLQTAMKESTDIRIAEKEKNELTITDAVDAHKAVVAAVQVLKDFYKKSAVATGFVQVNVGQPYYGSTKKEAGGELGVSMNSEEWKALGTDEFDKMDKGHKEGMQTFGAVYKGQRDEAGGVLAMLDVIASDFMTLKADTETSEAISAKAYKDFMTEAKRDIAIKTRKVEMNNQDKMNTDVRLNDDVADLKFTQDKLIAADKYYETLEPQCFDQGMTYDERSKARQEEIQSLKEALDILSQDNMAGATEE